MTPCGRVQERCQACPSGKGRGRRELFLEIRQCRCQRSATRSAASGWVGGHHDSRRRRSSRRLRRPPARSGRATASAAPSPASAGGRRRGERFQTAGRGNLGPRAPSRALPPWRRNSQARGRRQPQPPGGAPSVPRNGPQQRRANPQPAALPFPAAPCGGAGRGYRSGKGEGALTRPHRTASRGCPSPWPCRPSSR